MLESTLGTNIEYRRLEADLPLTNIVDEDSPHPTATLPRDGVERLERLLLSAFAVGHVLELISRRVLTLL